MSAVGSTSSVVQPQESQSNKPEGNNAQAGFENTLMHLHKELERLDLIIRRRIVKFRELNAQLAPNVPAAPTYVSDQEVDWLLSKQWDYSGFSKDLERLNQSIDELEASIHHAVDTSYQKNHALPLIQLASLFGLSWLEVQTLIICLAPELRRSYDRLYAYLQDDITRKRPSIDLVLDLFVDHEQERWQRRGQLSSQSHLFKYRLLREKDDLQSPSGSSGLAKMLRLDDRILQYLLGNNNIDAELERFAVALNPLSMTLPSQLDPVSLGHVDNLLRGYFFSEQPTKQRMLLHIHGPKGVGKKSLALYLCKKIGCSMLLVDVPALLSSADIQESLVLLCRESLLSQSMLYFEDTDFLTSNDASTKVHLRALVALLQESSWLTVFAGSRSWQPMHSSLDAGGQLLFSAVEVSLPEVKLRKLIWDKCLSELSAGDTGELAEELACKFSLTPAQIERSVETIKVSRFNSETDRLETKYIAEACRKQFNQGLNALATKITPSYSWDDLVLRKDSKIVLQSVCSQVRYKHQVFSQWGFDEKMAYGRGLSVLFSGSPGTGKTMTAQVMANDLQLDLYKIDLSGVVSKYIGETEKNLDRVFREAETSNAILFFDEADALFGKRTEVSDAHDRYANIEVSFLLQKIEEYDGIVILATNFRNNIDEAFVRRIRFIIEFPFPDQASRLVIWQKSIPSKAPIQDDIDFDWLAAKIKVSGGNIKNIVLNAAFHAAEEKMAIGMHHLISSAQKEFEKIGKSWDERNMNYFSNSGLN